MNNYYQPAPLTLSPVERVRLRERERELRAQMVFEEQASQEGVKSDPLFGEILRVNPTLTAIERKLCKFDDVKQLIENQDGSLLGIDGHPPPSPAPGLGSIRSSSSSSQSSHEFKKPNQCSQSSQPNRSSHHRDHHHHSSSSQRGGFVKPADGKPAYSGRGNYPGQPMKHSSSSGTDFRGMVPGKGPPTMSGSASIGSVSGIHSNSSGRFGSHDFSSGNSISNNSINNSTGTSGSISNKMHPRSSSLPKLLCEPLLPSSNPLAGSGVTSQANVENILDEMTSSVRTPLTAIAATPRKAVESLFTFNSASGKVEPTMPIKEPVLDKNTRANALSNILGPAKGHLTFLPTSIFKPNEIIAPLTSPITSPSIAAATGPSLTPTRAKSGPSSTPGRASTNINNNSGGDAAAFATINTSSGNGVNTNSTSVGLGGIGGSSGTSAPTLTSSATSSSKTPVLEADLSISEDSEGENYDNDSEDSRKSTSNQSAAVQKTETSGAVKSESSVKSSAMSSEEVHDSSSSDDSESDSGSESDDSSSDSPSPPALPLPVAPDLEDNKHQWNLKNFLPPSHGNSTPAPQTPKVCETDGKQKTEDSDSSGDAAQNARVASSSSSDSDSDNKTSGKKHKRSDDSTDADSRTRGRKYSRSSSSSSSSSDDSDPPTHKKKKKQTSSVVAPNAASTSTASAVPALTAAAAANSSTGNINAIEVKRACAYVKPHPRKPPSPQVCGRPQACTDDRFGFVQQQQQQQQQQQRSTMQQQIPTALDSQCDAESSGTMARNCVGGAFTPQRSSAASSAAVKSTEKQTKSGTGSGRGRKPKSPARTHAAAVEPPPAKKRRTAGRKKAVTKALDVTDSEDDEPKVKVPERKRPGRPPLKRNDDDEWTAGSRRKIIDKFPQTNVWGSRERERRRSSLRYSSFTPDSDSEVEQPTPPAAKPTARVQPVNKKRESAGTRGSRDSSCESARNENDFNMMSGSGSKSSVTKAEESPPKLDVEGATIADKKKSDTLRKLFSRREEGGGKGGGKGKGGKGKCGVIVESEAERKMSSPARSLHRGHDHPLSVEISPPPQQQQQQPSDDSSRRRGQERLAATTTNVSPALARPLPVPLPKLMTGPNGKPVLMCQIDLSKIPFFLAAKKRSEEMRTKTELSDTRQTTTTTVANVTPNVAPPALDIVSVPCMMNPLSDTSDTEAASTTASERGKHSGKKHSKQKSKSSKRKHHRTKEEPPPPVFTPTAHTPSVDPDSDSIHSDTEPRKKMLCTANQRVRPQLEPMLNLMNSCYPMAVESMQESSLGVEHRSEDETWRSNASSCSTCSGSPGPHRSDKYGMRSSSSKHQSKRAHRRVCHPVDHMQRHSSLMDAAPPMTLSVPSTSHGGLPPDPSIAGYPRMEVMRPLMLTHHGIYYSYLEHKVSEEMNSESDNISPNVYLMEAKRLKHAADSERDLVSQGMQYLEAILSFVLTGHVLERRSQIDTAFSMYSETLKLIVYISKKFRTLCTSAAQSNIPNKIAILSLRCESILNLKLYAMRDAEVRDVHTTVTDFFNKPVEAFLAANQGTPSPHSPTPSPASSVGSNSSGYSSGDRRTGGPGQLIAVPYVLHSALQKQHTFYSNLISSFNFWEEADKLIFSGNKDFFIELDRFCGPLTLHSSLNDLVHYVRVGIQRLKAIISHHHRV